jgi:hypothetical protein
MNGHAFPTVDESKLLKIQHQLLNPNLNSVNPEEIEPITDDIFPDRQGFITGHRIPLELFSKETIQKLNVSDLKTRLKILPVHTREHYTSLLHWV